MKNIKQFFAIAITFFVLSSSNLFAQGNFTTEWVSPAGWSFRQMAKLNDNSNILYIVLSDQNNFYNYRVYKGTTDSIKYMFTLNESFSQLYTIGGEGDVQVNKFDVNGDGVNEIVAGNSSSITAIINPTNGTTLFQISEYFESLTDIDDDGYVELITSQGGRIRVTSTPAQVVSVNAENEIVKDYELKQNYPNPFNPNTVIEYYLNKKSDVKVIIYDILGREIKTLVDQQQIAGTYKLTLKGSDLTSGTYFYSLIVDGVAESKKMILIK